MNIFEDSINLLKGAAFSNIQVEDSFIFLESPAIFSEYIVPLTFLDKFDTAYADDIFNIELEKEKNISYYIRQTLVDDYYEYLKGLKLSQDYIDSYMVLTPVDLLDFDDKNTSLIEVTEENFNAFKATALEIFANWSNEEDYVDYFSNLSKTNTETRMFKDYILEYNGAIVSIASVILDKDLNIAYIHNAGTVEEFRRNGYFNIINSFIINKILQQGIARVYSITEKDGESYNAYKNLGFKEQDSYYSFS